MCEGTGDESDPDEKDCLVSGRSRGSAATSHVLKSTRRVMCTNGVREVTTEKIFFRAKSTGFGGRQTEVLSESGMLLLLCPWPSPFT